MARAANRITVPPTDGPSAQELADLEMVDREFHQPGLDLYRETGDMAVLADAAFQDWSWTIYRMRSADEMVRDRAKSPRLWMGKLAGPLEVGEIQAAYGGGSFEVWGYFDKNLRTRMRVDVAGPRKNFDERPITVEPAPAAVAVPAAPSAPGMDPTVMRMLDELSRKIEALAKSREREGGIDMNGMLEFADRLNARSQPAPAGSPIGEVVEAFKLGAELGGGGGGSKPDTIALVIEKLAPVIENIGKAMVTARPRGMPPRPGAQRPAAPPAGAAVESQATIVPEPETPELDMDQVRMVSAVDALSRAISGGMPPEDFAETLGDILAPDQLHLLRVTPEPQVIAVLLGVAGNRYPVLEAESSKGYLSAVLAALKSEHEPAGD